MKFIDTTKSVLENLYLLSGPIVALFGFFIFKQIRLAKEQLNIARGQLSEAQKQLEISSKRDSIKLAAEQIRYFLKDIVNYLNALNDELSASQIEKIIIPTKEFNVKDIGKVMKVEEFKAYKDKIAPHFGNYLNVLNSLETFSTYFIQEVADENVAYESVGSPFCSAVENCSLILCIGSKVGHENHFCNTIKLYNIWSNRQETVGLKIQKANFEKEFKEKIEKVEKDIIAKTDIKISPLGTN